MVCVHSKKILINRNLCFMYRTNKPGSIDSHVCEIQVTDGHNEILLKIQVECGSELKIRQIRGLSYTSVAPGFLLSATLNLDLHKRGCSASSSKNLKNLLDSVNRFRPIPGAVVVWLLCEQQPIQSTDPMSPLGSNFFRVPQSLNWTRHCRDL